MLERRCHSLRLKSGKSASVHFVPKRAEADKRQSRLSTTIPGPGSRRPQSRTDRRRKEALPGEAGQSEPAGILPP